MKNELKSQVVIIGSGPAALTAAIYSSRANLEPILFEGRISEGLLPGGQLITTTDVDNFPGFPEGINGYDLIERMKEQAIKYGTTIYEETILSVDLSEKPYKLESNSYNIIADSIIISTGATANKLEFEGSDTYWTKGISACAVCDGACPIFRKKPLVVVGGGDSAMEEAIFLTKFASNVTIIHRRDTLRASKIMQKKAKENPKIEFIYSHNITKAIGDGKKLTKLEIKSNKGEYKEIDCNGLFYGIGHTPNTHIFKEYINCDENGYIITKPDSTETNIDGVFACGDVQDSKWRQAITAAGTGCMSALEVEKYLEK
jgi:thioredoxin reductase (NADPH)